MPHEKYRPRPATPPHGPGVVKPGPKKKPYADPGDPAVRNDAGVLDPFAGSSYEYDPHAVYSRATNSHDHSSKAQFSLPSPILGAVQEIVERHPEMRSAADFYRSATIHYLQSFYSADLDDWQNQELLAREQMFARRGQEEEADRRQADFITARGEYFQSLADQGYWEMLIRKLDVFDEDVITFGSPYQKRAAIVVNEFRAKAMKEMGP